MTDKQIIEQAKENLRKSINRVLSYDPKDSIGFIREALALLEHVCPSEKDYRICEFCGCHTNAKLRACCNDGRDADLAEAEAKAKTGRAALFYMRRHKKLTQQDDYFGEQCLVDCPDCKQAEPSAGELKYCKEHRTIHCSCQQRIIDAQQQEIECYKAMKEGVEIRIGDMQVEIDRLTSENAKLKAQLKKSNEIPL